MLNYTVFASLANILPKFNGRPMPASLPKSPHLTRKLCTEQCDLACESGPDPDVVASIRVDRSLAEVAALLLPLEGTSWVSLTNTFRLWGKVQVINS